MNLFVLFEILQKILQKKQDIRMLEKKKEKNIYKKGTNTNPSIIQSSKETGYASAEFLIIY